MADKTIVVPMEELAQMIARAMAADSAYDLVVTGTSMSPTLQPWRDSVRLVSIRQRPPRRGEIVLARRRGGGYMLHRVVRVGNGVFTLNGDGQVWLEDVDEAAVLAVVERITRSGREICCDSPLYRAYVALWGLTRPARGLLVRLKKTLTGKAGGR